MNSLASVGRTFLSTCGAMIFSMVCRYVRPRLRPASICPLSTERMPLRMISDTYAPELMPNASDATISPLLDEAKMM